MFRVSSFNTASIEYPVSNLSGSNFLINTGTNSEDEMCLSSSSTIFINNYYMTYYTANTVNANYYSLFPQFILLNDLTGNLSDVTMYDTYETKLLVPNQRLYATDATIGLSQTYMIEIIRSCESNKVLILSFSKY